MYPYRVFIAYDRDDSELFNRVTAVLTDFELIPISDRQLPFGRDFPDELRKLISRSHCFAPILTEHSCKSDWVNQEIGYALSLGIPVIPLQAGSEPMPGMLAPVQYIDMGANLTGLRTSLSGGELDRLIRQPAVRTIVEVVELWRQRSEQIAAYANDLADERKTCRIRHRGPVTSFSIPDKPLEDPLWRQCGMDARTNRDAREALYQERQALERHARESGCSLIINSGMELGSDFIGSRNERLKVLIDFLESMPDPLTRVCIVNAKEQGSILIVGDWFSATSHAPRRGGYRQSLIKWHAPTVLREMEAFDAQLDKALEAVRVKPDQSREWAIAELRRQVEA